MLFRSKATLEDWLEEFRAAGYEVPGEVTIQDGAAGSDTGLVSLHLSFALTSTYLQPLAVGDPRWRVTFEARHHDAVLTADQVEVVAREMQTIAALCAFLQHKSLDHADV